MEKLLTNIVTINATADQARKILANPVHLLKWVPEIETVNQDEHSFTVTRSQGALNHFEVITVEAGDSRIIYHSRQGRLVYDLAFTLTGADHHLQIQEALFSDTAKIGLPVKLIAPIAKHALAINLMNLGRLIEGMTQVSS